MNKLLVVAALLSASCKRNSDSAERSSSATSGGSADHAGSGDRNGTGTISVNGSGSVTVNGSGSVTVHGERTAVIGSGQVKTEARQVGGFKRIAFAGAMQGDVTIGSAQSVELTADDNIVPMVETTVADDQLRIATKGSIQPKTDIVARVTVPALTGVRVDGANRISIKGVAGEAFSIDVRGASKLVASGRAHKVEIDVSGVGEIDTTGLNADDVVLHASGSAKVDVAAMANLDVTASGTAHVTYRGSPLLHKRLSGVGTVEAK